jgi:hypothetical protein
MVGAGAADNEEGQSDVQKPVPKAGGPKPPKAPPPAHLLAARKGFDGLWVKEGTSTQFTIDGETVVWPNGDHHRLCLVEFGSCTLEMWDKVYNGKFVSEGRITWDNGSAWVRVDQSATNASNNDQAFGSSTAKNGPVAADNGATNEEWHGLKIGTRVRTKDGKFGTVVAVDEKRVQVKSDAGNLFPYSPEDLFVNHAGNYIPVWAPAATASATGGKVAPPPAVYAAAYGINTRLASHPVGVVPNVTAALLSGSTSPASGSTASPPKPKLSQSEIEERCRIVNGSWKKVGSDSRYRIEGTKLHWLDSGKVYAFEPTDEDPQYKGCPRYSANIEGNAFVAMLRSGNQLAWSNGGMWLREADPDKPPGNLAPSPGVSAAAAADNANTGKPTVVHGKDGEEIGKKIDQLLGQIGRVEGCQGVDRPPAPAAEPQKSAETPPIKPPPGTHQLPAAPLVQRVPVTAPAPTSGWAGLPGHIQLGALSAGLSQVVHAQQAQAVLGQVHLAQQQQQAAAQALAAAQVAAQASRAATAAASVASATKTVASATTNSPSPPQAPGPPLPNAAPPSGTSAKEAKASSASEAPKATAATVPKAGPCSEAEEAKNKKMTAKDAEAEYLKKFEAKSQSADALKKLMQKDAEKKESEKKEPPKAKESKDAKPKAKEAKGKEKDAKGKAASRSRSRSRSRLGRKPRRFGSRSRDRKQARSRKRSIKRSGKDKDKHRRRSPSSKSVKKIRGRDPSRNKRRKKKSNSNSSSPKKSRSPVPFVPRQLLGKVDFKPEGGVVFAASSSKAAPPRPELRQPVPKSSAASKQSNRSEASTAAAAQLLERLARSGAEDFEKPKDSSREGLAPALIEAARAEEDSDDDEEQMKGRWATDVTDAEEDDEVIGCGQSIEEQSPYTDEAASRPAASSESVSPKTYGKTGHERREDEEDDDDDMEDAGPLPEVSELRARALAIVGGSISAPETKVGSPPAVMVGDRRREQKGVVEETMYSLEKVGGDAPLDDRRRVRITSTKGAAVNLMAVMSFCGNFGEVVAMQLVGSGAEAVALIEFRDAEATQACVQQRDSESLQVVYDDT